VCASALFWTRRAVGALVASSWPLASRVSNEQLPKPPNPPECPSIPLKAFDLPGGALARELELDLWTLFQFPALLACV
jgi:hypothetical protein